jgi:hypothetical protein
MAITSDEVAPERCSEGQEGRCSARHQGATSQGQLEGRQCEDQQV